MNRPTSVVFFFGFLGIFGLFGPLDFARLLVREASSQEVVDLVAYETGRRAACAEATPVDSTTAPTCEVIGVVDRIRLEHGTTFLVCADSSGACRRPVLQSRSGRITLGVNGDSFYYLLRDPSYGDLGAPMSLFTASKINRLPVRIRFQNWGGQFYVTEASL